MKIERGSEAPLGSLALSRRNARKQFGFWLRTSFLCECGAKDGGRVKEWATSHHNAFLRVEDRALFGDDYAKAICSFSINLCFLRKLNRDLQTTRSIEIPACGAFMLAERTAEHRRLLDEGVEAEFFDNRDELLSKCRHYLSHEEERVRIAAVGRQRCVQSHYSYDDQLQGVLKGLEQHG